MENKNPSRSEYKTIKEIEEPHSRARLKETRIEQTPDRPLQKKLTVWWLI